MSEGTIWRDPQSINNEMKRLRKGRHFLTILVSLLKENECVFQQNQSLLLCFSRINTLQSFKFEKRNSYISVIELKNVVLKNKYRYFPLNTCYFQL